jgi:hypothetical protein
MRQFVVQNRRGDAQGARPVRSPNQNYASLLRDPKRKVSNGTNLAKGLSSNGVNIFAVFDKADLMDAIPASGRVELQVLGYLSRPGQYFCGSDTIRIITPLSKSRPRRGRK